MASGRVWLSLGLALALGLTRPALALAHAVVLASDPPGACPDLTVRGVISGSPACGALTVLATPPATVRLHFSEPVTPFGRGIAVLGPDGNRVDPGPVRVGISDLIVDVDARQTGTYVVQWQVISVDTHPTQGSYRFAVGHPGGVVIIADESAAAAVGGTVAPIGLTLQTAGRWLHFLGYALAFGVLAFRWLVIRPAGSPAWSQRGSDNRRLSRLIDLGMALLLLAEPLALLGQTGSLGADHLLDPPTVSAALDSSFGRSLALRLGAPVLLWVLLGIERGGGAWAVPVSLGVGCLLAVLDGFSAHAVGSQSIPLGLLANALHVAAMGLWVGGLMAVVASYQQVTPAKSGANQPIVLARFGRFAAFAVLVLGISGLAMALAHLSAVADLVATAYGITLTAKTAVVLLALAAAGIARTRPWALLRSVEALGLTVVLLLAALLVSLPPPR